MIAVLYKFSTVTDLHSANSLFAIISTALGMRTFLLPFLLCYVFFLAVSDGTNQTVQPWFTLVEETVNRCINHEARVHTYVSHTYNMYYHCFKQKWSKCINYQKEDILTESEVQLTAFWPCYKGDFIWMSAFKISFHIMANVRFQVKLTITSFRLKRSVAGCSLHHIQVSISFYNTFC